MIAWWAHVTDTPDLIKIIVFNKGIWKGLKGIISVGGHIAPISILGAKLLWKKAQKKETKKKISDTINKIIPQRSPLVTKIVCLPWYVPSRQISRHHWYMVKITIKYPKINKFILKLWNHFTIPLTKTITPIAPVKGQGL